MKKTNKRLFMLVGTTIFLCVIILIFVLMTKVGPQQKITNQLELGNRYLTEMDYEQAIVAFEQVIKIDPMNADAYLGLTDAYICLNEFDKAYETAKQGYDKTGDERLNEKILMIESGNIEDFEGRTHKVTSYRADGSIVYELFYTYSYNEYGVMTHGKELFYDEEGIREEHKETEYDENGTLLSVRYNVNGQMIESEENSFDSEGNISISRSYTYEPETGEMIRQGLRVWEYDQNNRKVKYSNCHVDNKTGEESKQYSFYEYDESNNCIAEKCYDADGILIVSDEFSYDAKGNETEYRRYDSAGNLFFKRVRIYNDSGNYIGCKEYDGNGNLIQIIMFE